MKKIYINIRTIIVLVIVLLTLKTSGQTVLSNCTALEEMKVNYRNDADQLALRIIYDQGLTYMDSIHIPQNLSGTVLNALIAVYNATELAARDTVIDMLGIHAWPEFEMNRIVIAAQPDKEWDVRFRAETLITGDPYIDSLIATHDLSVEAYYVFSNYLLATLVTKKNYNIAPLAELFINLPGIYYAAPANYIGDGKNIHCSIEDDHLQLVYSYGWGDCPSGCIYRRFWKFNVYYDCSVEFIDSYGDALYPPEPQPLPIPLPIPLPMPLTKSGEISETNAIAISVYPNPMKSYINIDGIDGEYSWTINNMVGQVVSSGISTTSRLDNLSGLTRGFYVLTIRTPDSSTSFRILKD